MERIQKYIVLTIIVLSAMLTVEQWYMGSKDIETSDSIFYLWTFMFSIIIGLWAQKDNNGVKFNKPFEFGVFVYFAWPIILPYYLFKTRGLEGMIIFIGFIALYAFPDLAWLVGWSYA